jgi:DNA-binding NarL/FixJ family response regulator
MQIIKTVLADDQCIFIEGLKTVLQRQRHPRVEIMGVACSGDDLVPLLQKQPVDLLILDLNLADTDGIEALKMLRTRQTPLKILVLSRYNDPKIVKLAFKAGADGYILKDRNVDELHVAIRELVAGNTFIGQGVSLNDAATPPSNGRVGQFAPNFADNFIKRHHLTKRELEILRLITDALSNKQIARKLYISDQTVSVHRKNMMRKLGVSNTAALIKAAHDNSLV